MSPHPFLRAYMAGIALPSLGLLVALTVFTTARYGFGVDLAIERLLIFPLAVIPFMWGVWNIVHLALERRSPLSLGLHGALLPLLLLPAGVAITHALDVVVISPWLALEAAPLVMIAYYLLWKHVVGFLNAELGIG